MTGENILSYVGLQVNVQLQHALRLDVRSSETGCLSLADVMAVTLKQHRKEQKRIYDRSYWQRLKEDPERYRRRIEAIKEKRKLRLKYAWEHHHPH